MVVIGAYQDITNSGKTAKAVISVDKDKYILKDVDLTIGKGKAIAVWDCQAQEDLPCFII